MAARKSNDMLPTDAFLKSKTILTVVRVVADVCPSKQRSWGAYGHRTKELTCYFLLLPIALSKDDL